MKPTSKQRRRQHDKVYRRIFNRPAIIEEILRRFVPAPWVSELDFSTLQPMPTDFVSLRGEKRESDILWRVRHGENENDWFFVFILMELQSKVLRFMALRLLGYLVHIAEALLQDKTYLPSKHPRLLPPILPVVLYNGDQPWTAPRSLAELFKPLEDFDLPDFRYVVLDVKRFPPEELRPVEAVTSGVFLMEQAADVEELEAVIEELEGLIEDPDLEHEEIPPMTNLREVKMSLLQRAEKWTQEWYAEGEAEGEVKGRRLGKAEALKALMRRRFGELSSQMIDRIDRADVDTLDTWLDRFVTAGQLEDIFAPA